MAKTILLLAASPEDKARLRVDQEYRDIKAGLERARNRDQFILVNQPAARVLDLRRAMLDLNPNIVHFCGHGSGKEGLVFEDQNGQAELVETEPLADFFANFAGTVECIVLNACYSEEQAAAIARHIPYVVGMKEEIGDAEAVEFAVAFYDALGAGRSIESAYELGCNAIELKDGSRDLIPILKKGPGAPERTRRGSGTVARRCALLVGTGTYAQAPELIPLLAPSNDVETLKGVLSKPEHCGFDEVVALADADLQTVRKAVEGVFLHAGPDDLLLFYFSGHGRLGSDQQLHLCTKDTELDHLFSTSFGLWELRQLIDGHDVSRVVIILDCCVSAASPMGPTGDLLSRVLQAELGKGRGKYVITASTTIEPCARRAQEKVSLFTKYLVEGLETEDAAHNGDGIITVDDLYRYAADKVKAEGAGQHPQNFPFECSLPDLILLRARRTARPSAGAPLAPLHPDWLLAVRTQFDHGKIIPFVGAGTYAGKVLNHFALSSALARRSGLQSASQESLAATAEYFERYHQGPHGEVERGRAELLDAFKEILTEQTRDVSPPETHKLIRQMQPPWLVVSTTYDMVLEDWLVREGVPIVIVSHILRCRDAVNDGKILVVRRGPNPSVKICPADDVPLVEKEDGVIYKILGSPFPDGVSDPELGLDTLVLTETDHIRFLGRLENQYTRVPTCFTLPFKKRELLYLGYSLDIWHYRLVLQLPVFQVMSYAVRQPASQMEAVFWERLGASMIDSNPEEFAKAMLKI